VRHLVRLVCVSPIGQIVPSDRHSHEPSSRLWVVGGFREFQTRRSMTPIRLRRHRQLFSAAARWKRGASKAVPLPKKENGQCGLHNETDGYEMIPCAAFRPRPSRTPLLGSTDIGRHTVRCRRGWKPTVACSSHPLDTGANLRLLPRSSAGLFHSGVPIRSAASPSRCAHDRFLGACTVYAWACRHLLGIQLAPLRRGFFLRNDSSNFPGLHSHGGLPCGPRSTTQIPKTCPARQRRGFSF
jgi:hypothetical protein